MKLRIIVLLSLAVTLCRAQTDPVSLDQGSVGEGRIVRTATFDGNSLWGYINGGADIYLEYGFNSVLVHEIEFKGQIIRFDLYRMKDPLAAFGIFSVYSFRCDSTTGPGRFNCGTKWQIQSVAGDYYLSVILPTGSREEYVYASGIAGVLLSNAEKIPLAEIDIFNGGNFDNIRGRIQYARGKLGLDNGISFNTGNLIGMEFRDLWYISEVEGFGNLTVTAITFSSPAELEKFITTVKSAPAGNSKTEIFRHVNGTTAIITGGDSEQYDSSVVLQWFGGIKQ
ncbi:MAG: hypothetical protein IH591_18865 [Bacteroidales bacterium]|nr:hypothetical protein [Bacteroidales bacterium]